MLKKLTIPKGWKSGAVGDLVKGIRGVTFSSEDILSSDEPSAVVILRSNNIKDSRINFEEVYLLPSTNVSEHQIAQPGDVAVCMSNGSRRLVGKAARLTEAELKRRVSVGAFCALFRPTTDADINFVPYLFDTESYRRELDITLAGSAINNLKNSDIEGIKIPLPPLAEQRKIAEILRTWDESIETAEAELKAKQERKRVLMQGLFSKKDCVESFEGRYITEIAELSKDRPQGNETVCVDLEHVSPSAGQLIGSLPVNGDEVSKLRFRKDDVLFAKLRPYLKKAWLSDREGICSSEFWVFRAKQDLGDPAFLRQFVLSEPFLEACAASSGSKMPRADWAHVEKIKFMLPSLNEQRVTAGILQAADAEIDAINAIIKHLITQKRGLMQKLLTGEIRVAA